MSGNKDNMKNYVPFVNPPEINTAESGRALAVAGYGDIDLVLDVGNKQSLVTLKGVYHVPGMSCKLFSFIAFDSNDFRTTVRNGKIVVRNSDHRVVAVAIRTGSLYTLQEFHNEKAYAGVAKAESL
jgi:hypothetical protein